MRLYKHSTLVGAVLFATASFAEDPPTATEQETARLAQQTALLTAQANLATAKAALDQAKVKALGLPEFKNETTLDPGGGVIEANMLASRAVRAAANHIKLSSKCTNAIDGLSYLMLTPLEKFDVNAPIFVQLHAGAIQAQLRQALDLRADTRVASLGAGAILGIVQAAASLFANETKVSGIDLPSINDAALIMATAGSLCGKGIVPSASMGMIDLEHSTIINKLSELQTLVLTAADARRRIPDDGKDEHKRKAAALEAAMTSYDGFITKIGTVDSEGQSPLSQALLIERYPIEKTYIVRIAVNKAGGSIINSKNLWTTLGVDPVKVSGGLVVSYSITKADTGAVETSETFTCQTSLASIRKIQNGRWTALDAKTRAEKPTEGKYFSEAFCR